MGPSDEDDYCPTCDGTGECPDCDGEDEGCLYCNGSGECQECDGAGRLAADGEESP